MAWRPTQYLLEGELDNTTPGKVTGWMRFAGMNEQVTFDLEGDFHRDIRGAKIRFEGDGAEDEKDARQYMDGFAEQQTGNVGDITAGRAPFRDVFGRFDPRLVLEHHNNFETQPDRDRPGDAVAYQRLASENWDAPLVVTTNVQFFESLFAASPSRCRKLHNIARSVIILDEVQTLPVDLLEPCLAMIRELVINYGCTVVMCSATQPAVAKRDGFRIGLDNVNEIIPDPLALQRELRRTTVSMIGPLPDLELTDQLRRREQALCVVNSTRHAAELHERLANCGDTFHLSARMCPAHRTQRLKDIRQQLANDRPCRVVSTQLVEAGVDIDFPVVFRAITGIDSIAQAAGRCNREGKRESGEVFVFEPEPRIPRGDLRQAADAAREMVDDFDDLLGIDAIDAYFKHRYWTQSHRWDRHGIMDLFKVGEHGLDFAFRTCAERFRMIPDGTRPIIIPWGDEGESICRDVETSTFPPDRARARQAQRYTVSIHEPHWLRLLDAQEITLHHERFAVLANTNLYDEQLGLRYERSGQWDPEYLMV